MGHILKTPAGTCRLRHRARGGRPRREEGAGGLRFHDLRHSYATHLVSSGVPVNDVQRVMGHEQASTTLNLYTHASSEQDARVRNAFA